METDICKLNQVCKKYGSEIFLGPVSLCIHGGEVLGVRGANGAGKSTLLGLMAGVLRPDAGSLQYAPGVQRAIGYVPQDIALYPSLSGQENLAYWARVQGMHGEALRLRVRWLLEQAELTEKAKKRVETYSGGMKRRLNLAAALVTVPRLLLLDEPTAGADTHSAQLILAQARQMALRFGSGVVMVTHRGEELEAGCDRVVTLEAGMLKDAPQDT